MPRTRRRLHRSVEPVFRSRHTRALSVMHLGVLLLLAAEMMLFYSATWQAGVLLLTGALIAELVPIAWRRHGVGELCLLGAGAVSYLAARDAGAVDGWIRLLLLCWSLIPARVGMLRVLLPLAVLELLTAPSTPAWRIAWLSGWGIAGMFLDQWLQPACMRHPDVRMRGDGTRGWMRPLVIACLLVLVPAAGIAHFAGPLLLQVPDVPIGGDNEGPSGRSLAPTVRIGDHTRISQDPVVIATVRGWPQEVLYLRALTLADPVLSGHVLEWGGAGENLQPAEGAPPPDSESALLVQRRRGGDDILLLPDGGAGTAVSGQYADDLDNRFLSGQNLAGLLYRCHPPNREYAASDRDQQNPRRQRWYRVPIPIRDAFADMPEIERWRLLTPGRAAQAITVWLRSRCRYALEDLPTVPSDDPAGGLQQFLFGEESQRRGHCQYFTSAATVLLRLAGHPVRPVIGYASDESYEGTLMIRGMHAHAWIEILDGRGMWRRFDPTPPEVLRGRSVDAPTGTAGDTGVEAVSDDDWRWSFWSVAAPTVALLALLAAGHHFMRGRPPSPSRRQKVLARQSQDLLACARRHGIDVQAHRPLSAIAIDLQARSGVPINEHLRRHLEARFGAGELPPPWPIAAIDRAMRQNQSQ